VPVFLARHYAAVTDVERGDDAPAAFVWRGRRYVVRAVLDHWWETAAWWVERDDGADGLRGDDERERWRVEAVSTRGLPVIVELAYAWARGVWSLETVMD
jgi:hypothetical protein